MAEQKLYLNIQEQVEKNKNDIQFMLEEEGTLNKFGIKVIGQEDDVGDMPSVADYKEDHEDWAYGDAYAIGTEPPYTLYILTRANGTHPDDYWFNIGQFPVPGPQGEQGEQGPAGHTPQVTAAASASTLSAGSSATVSVSNTGTNDDPEFSFSFGIPKGDKGDTGEPGRPGAFHINGQVASAALLPDASQVDPTAAYAVGSVLPYDVYVIMTVEGVQSWLNLGPVLTEISDTYELNISGTSGSLTQEQVDALVNDTKMNFLKIGNYFYFKSNFLGTLIEYINIYLDKYVYSFFVNTVSNTFSYSGPVEIVDISSAQTITGIKLFYNGLKIPVRNGIGIELGDTGNTVLDYYDGTVRTSYHLRPFSNNSKDIGTSSYKWRNAYLEGQVYAQNTFNVINASDIASNQILTEDQYALITNGKPTLIKGTFANLNNPILLVNGVEYSSSISGILIGENNYRQTFFTKVAINTSTKLISVYSNTFSFTYDGRVSINGKNLPSNPSSPADDQVLVYGTDNALKWAKKTKLFKHVIDLGSSATLIFVSTKSTAYSDYLEVINDFLQNEILSASYYDGSVYKRVLDMRNTYIFYYNCNSDDTMTIGHVSFLGIQSSDDTVTNL